MVFFFSLSALAAPAASSSWPELLRQEGYQLAPTWKRPIVPGSVYLPALDFAPVDETCEGPTTTTMPPPWLARGLSPSEGLAVTDVEVVTLGDNACAEPLLASDAPDGPVRVTAVLRGRPTEATCSALGPAGLDGPSAWVRACRATPRGVVVVGVRTAPASLGVPLLEQRSLPLSSGPRHRDLSETSPLARRVDAGTPAVKGALSEATIATVLRRTLALTTCPAGTATLDLAVAADGAVIEAEATGDPALADCLRAVGTQILFLPAPGGTQIAVPVTISPAP